MKHTGSIFDTKRKRSYVRMKNVQNCMKYNLHDHVLPAEQYCTVPWIREIPRYYHKGLWARLSTVRYRTVLVLVPIQKVFFFGRIKKCYRTVPYGLFITSKIKNTLCDLYPLLTLSTVLSALERVGVNLVFYYRYGTVP